MKNWISSFFGVKESDTKFSIDISKESIDFFCDQYQFNKIKKGDADEFITAQFVALQMLAEEGSAEVIPNGFVVPHEVIVSLDEDAFQLLQLPKRWDDAAEVDIRGTTGSESFSVSIDVTAPSGRMTAVYKRLGSILTFGDSKFTLTAPMFNVFSALECHANSAKSESDNLLLLHQFQLAQKAGTKLSLSHFDKLNIHVPDKITVEAELDEWGNLILTPNMGQTTGHEQLQRVLGQLQSEAGRTLKVGNEIILFDEKTAKAVKEIISHRKIPKSQVEKFLKAPGAFLDASLVDLDVGFAVRVKGAIRFKHAYFGETDETGINWFGQSQASGTILPISAVTKVVKTLEDLQQLQQVISDARATGAAEVVFEGKVYDIGSEYEVNETLEKLGYKLRGQPDDGDGEPSGPTEPDEPDLTDDGPIVIDIALNDDELDSPSKIVEEALNDVLYKEELDWSNHKRQPFPHQLIGVQWILGLEEMAREKELVNGALLADDMGLGKTFMSLSAIEHYYRICDDNGETCRPTLIVAPLSLLENWKDEVGVTFHESPFRDIVILQSDGELNRFRDGSIEIRAANFDEETIEPRYSLKFGEKHGLERLDLPRRLVITTYQTLRDYQFSLSQIDWGLAIFDEAQNTKNPNALQTRAAKALKAKFKLLATGTPVENSLADFWCLMDTACQGYLGTYQDFRQTYITPILQAAGDEADRVRATLGRKLREKVGALMLRRVKEDNLEGLPQKTILVGIESSDWLYEPKLHSVMTAYQQRVYEGAIEAQLEDEDSHMLTTLMRLRDSSLHPRLADSGRLDPPTSKREIQALFDESAKMAKTIEVLSEIQSRKEKCIIFAVNKRLQRFLSIALGSYFGLGPLHVINGDTKAVVKRQGDLSRKSLIADFEAKDGFNIIIMSPVAAGVGLTVVGANNVIHFERHWNPAKEAQATDRVYRIGQKKDVNIYVPILHHPSFESFDVNLHRLLSQKSMLKDAVVTPGEVMPNPTGSGGNHLGVDSLITFDDMPRMSWKQFEAYTLEVLAREYQADSAWLTKDGSDFGADGILATSNQSMLIQAKHKHGAYKGHSAVQEISNAKVLYAKHLGREISKLIFVTNATQLAKSARDIANLLDVTVIDGNELKDLSERHCITFGQVLTRLSKERYVFQ
ncbi:SNF2-related protein [Shewanella baltica]|uniref:SNF2-related protein n=1 Tax=Shewanella baltica TaxID=62322 RepID=UPI002168622A|nr:SNF2-related protein [Shewanella baltica]MCS6116307.1 helicase [Shewanella baltica]UVW63941.1 helicase [Shewanella baltica]